MQNSISKATLVQEENSLQDDKIMVEMFVSTSPALANVYNDMFVKEYTTALLKLQWGRTYVQV